MSAFIRLEKRQRLRCGHRQLDLGEGDGNRCYSYGNCLDGSQRKRRAHLKVVEGWVHSDAVKMDVNGHPQT